MDLSCRKNGGVKSKHRVLSNGGCSRAALLKFVWVFGTYIVDAREVPNMETLRITLFGRVNVTHSNSSEPLKLSRSIQAILAYLLLQQDLVSRDVLMDVFWMDSPPDRARSNLTTAIWRLRQLLEPDDIRPGTYLINTNTGEIGFNWACSHWLDTEAFERPIRRLLRTPVSTLNEEDAACAESVLDLYHGELLAGMYQDWALTERERYRSLYLNCMSRLMEFHANGNSLDRSISYGQEILLRDPLREEIHRDLMRIFQQNGQRALAIRQYTLCKDLLNKELGVPPLEETDMLYREIAAASSAAGRLVYQQPVNPDVTQLARELQTVMRRLDETAQTFAQIVQALDRLTSQTGDSAIAQGKTM